MRKFLSILSIAIVLAASIDAKAQCSTVTLNWDYLDYFTYQGNYTSANYYLPALSWAQTQNFAFGTQRLTITNNYAASDIEGDVSMHTGETGSYGAGDDIKFTGNGAITLSFENEVSNLKFSMYDVDRNQRVRFDARNAANVLQPVTLTKLGSSILTTSNGTAAQAQAAASTNVGNTAVDASFNIDISGPVKTITITIDQTATNINEDGSFFISDITACSAGSFPTNYYNISKPFTGQASYILTALDKSVYAVNTATGFSRFLFTDNSSPFGGSSFINSMAYDPYKRVLYYVYSLTGSPATNKMLKKYDFNTGNISTVLSDITSTTYGTGVGIPVTDYAGVESGAAAFYGGSLYLGIETSNSGRNSGREAVIWRIDFDVSNIPSKSSQVFALPVDNGNLLHDWADFAINDGILYDFDAANYGFTPTDLDVYQLNMMTGAVSNYSNPSWVPGQNGVGWDGKVYQVYAYNPTGTSNDVAPYIALYNGSGGIGATTNLTAIPAIPFPNPPSLGDAAEAFRWPVDFGDAPSSYDAVGLDPGVNEISSSLYLGGNEDDEMISRGQTALANSDNYDDGLVFTPIFNPLYGNYLTQTRVYNNTGANATICAWLDYNGNGKFDASEGISVNVPSSASPQLFYLYWPSAPSSLAMGSFTYLRIRVTSASNVMTTANATGYYNNGETEDYRIPVNTYPLAVQLLSFNAEKTNDKKVNLQWQVAYEQSGTQYDLQRSSNMQSWTSIHSISVSSAKSEHNYIDPQPMPDASFYRLKLQNIDGSISYSETKKIVLDNNLLLTFSPNPVTTSICLTVNGDRNSLAHLSVTDMNGRLVHKQVLAVQRGANTINLPFVEKLNAGVYSIQLVLDNKLYTEKMVRK